MSQHTSLNTCTPSNPTPTSFLHQSCMSPTSPHHKPAPPRPAPPPIMNVTPPPSHTSSPPQGLLARKHEPHQALPARAAVCAWLQGLSNNRHNRHNRRDGNGRCVG